MSKKVFISQPMKGLSDEEILDERARMTQLVIEKYPDDEIEFLDTFFQGAPAEARPLWYLAKSLEFLSTADVAVFAPRWEEFRGCRIEHTCAVEYGIDVIDCGF